MLCRFEDRLADRALVLEDFRERIAVHTASELDEALARIEAAQRRGLWVALLLDYELGAWLEPAASAAPNSPVRSAAAATDVGASTGSDAAPLTALVFGAARQTTPWQAPPNTAPFDLRAHALMRRGEYLAAVDALRAAIANGELYQANFTFPIALQTDMAPRDLYRQLAAHHRAAHAAYIEDGRRAVLSLSPELFFERRGDRITVRPMKGTAPRHTDAAQDRLAGTALLGSNKNRAENLMIVDLLRNDLGRLATPGSVNVDALFSLEAYPSVWQLTSTISARAPDASLPALLRALFPCGSITGAPKIAAMRKIQALEIAPRGIYCGSIGWLAPDGDCSLNVAIRTIEMPNERPGHGVLGVGGGIVYDSDPAQEWEECLWKARVLGLGAARPTPIAFVD
ncbi:aminodeoxychorismate synthase component I [Pusillimonas sp. TS35]|uniref:aminodeoxychorismate synthase component I n=1 Tax=Paracandidimonas lactea TaxID=2895524 RepID=UPI001370E253|nr:aminodeoxychorismate synthase component I [Paracandidimonas lactea]MYN14578.1 aminodeoxychorismate synthase component I [Pusillimonas sp. TS35]